MPVLDAVIDPSGAVSGARVVSRSLDQIGNAAQQMEGTLKGAVGMLKGLMLSVVAGLGIKEMSSGFLQSAVSIQNYQTSLSAVVESAEEAKKTFADINQWAALNPVNTDDAINAFVMMKTAAIDNTKEAVMAAADLAVVTRASITDVSSAIISQNAIQLRRLGIQIDRTGKEAIIRSGKVRLAVENDVDAIRAGIVKVIQQNYGGMMQKAGDNWSAVIDTMSGMWDVFKQKVMGDAGTGGPFDVLLGAIQKVRNKWDEWMRSPDYGKAVAGIQSIVTPVLKGLVGVLEGVGFAAGFLAEHIGTLTAAFVVFAGVKGVGMATAALAYFQKQWLLGTNLVAGATSMVAKMGSAFTAFKAAPGYINGIGAALTALGLTPGGMVLTAIAGLVVVAQTLDDTFEKARKGLVNFNTELKSVDTDKLKKVVDSAGGIMGGWRESVELASRDTKRMASDDRRMIDSGHVEENVDYLMKQLEDFNMEKFKKEVVDGVARMRDQIKYLDADGVKFLGTLEEWKKKLPELSEEWKAIVDLQKEILEAGKKQGGSAFDRIRDAMGYLNVDGERFLPILDKWKAKLTPLSDEWKKIHDLQKEILEMSEALGPKDERTMETLKKGVEKNAPTVMGLSEKPEWAMSVISESETEKIVQLTDGITYLFDTIDKATGESKGGATDLLGLNSVNLDPMEQKLIDSIQRIVPAGNETGEAVGKAIHDNMLKWVEQAVQVAQTKINSLQFGAAGKNGDPAKSIAVAGRGL